MVYEGHYSEKPVRIWWRDRPALIKALCRYGKACDARGWEFDEHHIFKDLLGVLTRLAPPQEAWLPVYLEGAVDRHVRKRAEELSAKAKSLLNITGRASNQLVIAKKVSATETMARLYDHLNKKKPKIAKTKQLELI